MNAVHSKPPTQRQLRVAEEIRHLLADLFARTEFRDPELKDAQITVTEVRVGPDLKRATAYVSRLGRQDIDALLPALRRATPFLRAHVAHALRLKFAPDLTFQPDHALDEAMKIDELLHRPDVARDLTSQQPSPATPAPSLSAAPAPATPLAPSAAATPAAAPADLPKAGSTHDHKTAAPRG